MGKNPNAGLRPSKMVNIDNFVRWLHSEIEKNESMLKEKDLKRSKEEKQKYNNVLNTLYLVEAKIEYFT